MHAHAASAVRLEVQLRVVAVLLVAPLHVREDTALVTGDEHPLPVLGHQRDERLHGGVVREQRQGLALPEAVQRSLRGEQLVRVIVLFGGGEVLLQQLALRLAAGNVRGVGEVVVVFEAVQGPYDVAEYVGFPFGGRRDGHGVEAQLLHVAVDGDDGELVLEQRAHHAQQQHARHGGVGLRVFRERPPVFPQRLRKALQRERRRRAVVKGHKLRPRPAPVIVSPEHIVHRFLLPVFCNAKPKERSCALVGSVIATASAAKWEAIQRASSPLRFHWIASSAAPPRNDGRWGFLLPPSLRATAKQSRPISRGDDGLYFFAAILYNGR